MIAASGKDVTTTILSIEGDCFIACCLITSMVEVFLRRNWPGLTPASFRVAGLALAGRRKT